MITQKTDIEPAVATLRLELRVKNNRLWTEIHQRWPTVAACCRALHIEQGRVGEFLNLKRAPYYRLRQTELLPSATALCVAFKMLAEDLFPLDLYSGVLPKAMLVAEIPHEALESVRETLALPAWHPDQPDHVVQERELRETLSTVLRMLTPREEQVIRLRYGIDDGVEHTANEAAAVVGVTRVRINQLEHRALQKLRHPSRSQRIKPFLEGE